MNFIDKVKERAKRGAKTIALPETGDLRTLAAAERASAEGLARIILIGSEDEIRSRAAGLKLSGVTFVDPSKYERFESLAEKLYDLRKSKGMTPDEARCLLAGDWLYLGVMLVKEGVADGMVAGAVNATANVLRPSLQILKTAPGTKLVSAFFAIDVPDCEYGENGTFLFADSGLVQNPTAEELAHIAVSSAKSFRSLVQAEPVVAMLSHSTKGSARHPDVDKVVQATAIAKTLAPDLTLDGELQLDAAIVPSVGVAKAPGSPAAGRANVLIFPDLDSGNIGYKLAQRLAKADAFGPITQGIAKPVNDLSRGASADDIVGVIAITAVQARG
ncbi:MAG: phosphate acetyltransferase [Clostridiales bacterium]|nr:phosphate acetyltransferase [Clostridiales bacterium]